MAATLAPSFQMMIPRQPISDAIWLTKYRFNPANGEGQADFGREDTYRRVANTLFANDEDLRASAFDVMVSEAFSPAGRILAGTGTGRAVTLMNCYVMGTILDDLGSIFSHLREAALTMQQGGGIGYDFSTLRPKGALVKGVGADASGPLSFMDVWDSMCRTIMSAGSRRGAMMATLRCDHPDIEDFIDAKREPGRLRMFNLSILVTDAFMAAVKADAEWPLVFGGKVYRTLRARDLWDRIMQATYAYAEPGVLFIDRINDRNNLYYCERISCTNPCGERPLPPYGACDLGSINLAALVLDAFTGHATIDETRLAEAVTVGVATLDAAIDASNFPLEAQRQEAQSKRRIGLGITGLANALMMMRLRYGSDAAVAFTEAVMRKIKRLAYLASVELAKTKGAFPAFDKEKFLAAPNVQDLDDDVKAAIAQHGIRNAELTSIAPTGTMSMLLNYISGGIEPAFAFIQDRNVLNEDGTKMLFEKNVDYGYMAYCTVHGLDPFAPETLANLPDYMVTSDQLSPMEHLRMQAAAQAHTDASISKTINCPEDLPYDAFKDIYMQAFDLGCKGVTTYRPNPITGSVIVASTLTQAPADDQPVGITFPTTIPDELDGRRYKVTNPATDENIYIEVNHITDPVTGCQHVWEVFANTYDENAAQVMNAATLAISLAYQSGDQRMVKKLLDRYAKVRGDMTIWYKGQSFSSLLPLLVYVVRQRAAELAAACAARTQAATPAAPVQHPQPVQQQQAKAHSHKGECPRCHSKHGLVRHEGCMECTECGWQKCGA